MTSLRLAFVLIAAPLLLQNEGCEEPPVTCSFELPTRFESVEELECGLTPDGVALCHWSLSFDGTEFVWMHSDIGEIGKFECEGEVVTGDTGYAIYEGRFDAATGILHWEGEEYLQP